jgi:hypothetical protein
MKSFFKSLICGVLLAVLSIPPALRAQSAPLVTSSCSTSAITVTNASQALIAANGLRRILLIQNNHATATIYFAFGSTAATTAMPAVVAGGSVYWSGSGIPNQAVNLIGSVASNTTVSVMECS